MGDAPRSLPRGGESTRKPAAGLTLSATGTLGGGLHLRDACGGSGRRRERGRGNGRTVMHRAERLGHLRLPLVDLPVFPLVVVF
jgi:hypothetical protein